MDQRFKATHEPLVKALSSFESMESHGEPIKPLLRQLITWTPPKEGITLLAASRMMELTARFPQQFATTAWKASFTFLPSDIQLI
jgi:hypothetical protein